jgi:LPXTG-site transpeptidase (sortase) family protein
MYENMRIGAAMFPRAPEPNTVANICISAHRTGTRDYFRNLDKLSVGDTIYLHTSHLGSFEYEVVKVSIIEKNDWSVSGDVGYPALTLLSCQAFGGVSNAQRIMVRAKLVGVANGQK